MAPKTQFYLSVQCEVIYDVSIGQPIIEQLYCTVNLKSWTFVVVEIFNESMSVPVTWNFEFFNS